MSNEFEDDLFANLEAPVAEAPEAAPDGLSEAVLDAAEPPPPDAPPAEVFPDDAVPLHLFAERAYLTYAMSTVLDRALPFVEAGQKPVQPASASPSSASASSPASEGSPACAATSATASSATSS